MADSAALRVRRSRAHKAGDHSLCKRCAVVRGTPPGAAPVMDALAALRQLAADVLADYAVNRGNALLVREARMALVALIEASGVKAGDDELDRLFADLDAASVPAPAGHS